MKHDVYCSFCGANPSAELLHLFPGPDVSICSACAGSALQTILDGRKVPAAAPAPAEPKPACCSFCRQPAAKVKWMHSRNGHGICDQCLVFCVDLALADKKPLPYAASP